MQLVSLSFIILVLAA